MAGTELSTELEHHHHDHAHHEDGPIVERDISEQNALSLSFAFLAGLGVILMMAAGAIGVIEGENADGALMGLLFVGGTACLIAGGVAWGGIVRPWEAFPSVTEDFYGASEIAHSNHDDHEESALALPETEAEIEAAAEASAHKAPESPASTH